jgi:hypothetical protein
MPEFFSSFPSLDVKPAQQGMTISEMVNLGRLSAEAKKSQISAQQTEIANNEQARVAAALQENPALFQDDNGLLDIDKVNKIIPQLAPRTGAQMIDTYTQLHKSQSDAISAKLDMTQKERAIVGNTLSIIANSGEQDPAKYIEALDNLKDQFGPGAASRYIEAAKVPWSKMTAGPQVQKAAIVGGQSLLSSSEQTQLFGPKAGTLNLGQDIVQTTTRTPAGGGAPTMQIGPTIAKAQIPPGSKIQSAGTDASGNPMYAAFDAYGNYLGNFSATDMGAAPSSGGGMGAASVAPTAPVAPSATGGVGAGMQQPTVRQPGGRQITFMPPGETAATLKAAQDLRLSAKDTAAQVPNQLYNNNKIIELADKTITGKNADFASSLTGGYAGLQWTSDNASNYQQLGHYMSQQQSLLANSAGLGGTDAARQIAGDIAGTTKWTPDAIKATARTNRSLATAADLLNRGIDNAFNRTNDPFSAPRFQQQWTRMLGSDGMDAIRLYDAIRNSKDDPAGVSEVIKSFGGQKTADGQDTPRYARAKAKIELMKKLIGGQ